MSVFVSDRLSAPASSAYITGWDGVRALAVIAVIAFHFWPDAVPGGFLGVTTFLVLAGALAVMRIGGEVRDTDAFSWRSYAAGRIRRLIPALLAYLVAVLGWTWLRHPEFYDDIARDVAAAALYLTPWREMAGSATYETAFASTPEPALHTWSLGVEELAWIATGVAVALTTRVRSAAVVTTAAGLAGYLIWFAEADLYYSPARLLEFGVGAWLGLILLRSPVRPPNWLTIGAGALLVWACLTWSVEDVYSGRLVAAAVLSAIVVSAAVDGPLGRFLSVDALVWIGRRSYALYLWHVGVGELTELDPVMALVVTVVASDLSYRFVESPLRRRARPGSVSPDRAGNGRTRGHGVVPLLLVATIVVAAVAALGPRPTVARADVGELLDRARATSTGPGLSDTSSESSDDSILSDIGADDIGADDNGADDIGADDIGADDNGADDTVAALRPPAGVDDTSPSTSETDDSAPSSTVDAPLARRPDAVLVVGDSTAVRLEEPLAEWGRRSGVEVSGSGFLGCSLAGRSWELRLGLPGLETLPPNDGCSPDEVALARSELVVVSHQGSTLLEHRRPGEEWKSVGSSSQLRDEMAGELRRIADASPGPVVLLSIPRPGLDGFGAEVVEAANDLLAAVAESRVDVVLLDASVVEHDPGRYPRSDGVHLDPEGAAAFIVDVLEPALFVAGGRAG